MNNSTQQYNDSNNESYNETRMNEQCNYQMNHPYSPAPSIPIKLFVSSIPKNLTENELKGIFEEFGEIKDIVFIKDKKPNMNKANVFIYMESIYYAQQAINTLHSKKVICDNLGPIIVKFANGELEKYGLNQNNINENEAKLFVGSLPREITEEYIRNVFNRYGNVTEIYIIKNNTGMTKRCAFVTYSYIEQALFAIQNLHRKIPFENSEIPIEVRFAETKNQLQEKQLLNKSLINPLNNSFNQFHSLSPSHPQAHTQTQFKNLHMNSFNKYQLHNYNLQNQQRQNINSPWKQYFSKENGRSYYHNEITGQTQWNKPRKLNTNQNINQNTNLNQIDNINLNLNHFINPLNEMTGPTGANIFIFHVPNEWNQNDLFDVFSPFGNIISAHIAREKETGRNRGFAFVSYDNVDSAINAVKFMNGFLAHKKKLKVTIKKGEEQYVQALLNQRNKINNDNRKNLMNNPHS